jgi:type I restriction enzyme, S subunit
MPDVTIPSGWESKSLGDLGQYINGRAFKPTDWTITGLPIIRIQNLTDKRKPSNYFDGAVKEKYRVQDGDLLVSWSASLGAFIWDRGPAVLNQHIFRVLPNEGFVTRDLLYYTILNALERMKELTHGSTMRHITKAKFEALDVPVPPLAEQQRIVGRIREAMERVDEAGRLRDETVAASQALLPSLLKEVFDGVVDRGLETRSLGKIIRGTKYGTSQKCSPDIDGLPILRIPNIDVGAIDLGKMKYLSWEEADVQKLKLKHGDILLVRTNGSPDLVGRCAVFDIEGVYGYASYLIRLRPNPEVALPKYLAYYLESTAGRDQIAKRRRTSAGQFNINSSNLKTVMVPLPTLTQQHELVLRMDEIRTTVLSTLGQQLDSQKSESVLPSAILRRAFAGEL